VAEHSGSLRVIIAAIAGNVAIAICKFGAALVTGRIKIRIMANLHGDCSGLCRLEIRPKG
jgi:hypothetical protein